MKRALAWVLVVLAHPACGRGVTDPWIDVAIVTVGTEFTVVLESVAIPYLIGNLSSETTYHIPGRGCGIPDLRVDQRLDGQWVEYTRPPSGPCPAIYGSGDVILAPFETYEGEIGLSAPGVFRLRFPVSVRGDPDSERDDTSNPFLVR